MNIKELMEIDIDNLIEKQYDGLKQYVIDKLKNVVDLIEREEYEKIEHLLDFSPAGDGYGCNNHYIKFDYDGYSRDIEEVIGELKSLKNKQYFK